MVRALSTSACLRHSGKESNVPGLSSSYMTRTTVLPWARMRAAPYLSDSFTSSSTARDGRTASMGSVASGASTVPSRVSKSGAFAST